MSGRISNVQLPANNMPCMSMIAARGNLYVLYHVYAGEPESLKRQVLAFDIHWHKMSQFYSIFGPSEKRVSSYLLASEFRPRVYPAQFLIR